MSDPVDESSYNTVAESARRSSSDGPRVSKNVLDEAPEQEQQNIEENSSQNVSTNNEEDEQAKKGKFQSAKANVKKINSFVKSRIDVLNRVPGFKGKKKGEKQDKGEKNDQKPATNSKDNKQKLKTELNFNRTLSEEMLIPADGGGATGYVSQDASTCDDSRADGTHGALVDLNNDVDFMPHGTADPKSPLAFDGNRIWPEVLSNGPEQDSQNELSLKLIHPNKAVNLATEPFLQHEETPPFSVEESSLENPEGECIYRSGQEGDQDTLVDRWPTMKKAVGARWSNTIHSTTSSVAYAGNRGCLEGLGPAVPIDFMHPVSRSDRNNTDLSEYERFYFQSIGAEQAELTEDQNQIENGENTELFDISNHEPGYHLEEQQFDDDYSGAESLSEDDDQNFWGSEFDDSTSYQDEVLYEVGGYDVDEIPDKPLPAKPGLKSFFTKSKPSLHDKSLLDDQSSDCLPVTIDSEKHPPPELPPQPSGLSQNQIKRRLAVKSIIDTERSYLNSLERLITEYETTVLEYISQPKSHVRRVFTEMKQIISHHRMFQIELSECVKVWDQVEKIGDIFTASFSKTMLINAYSAYVNSFAAAMEEIRASQRSKQAFQDFLLKQEKFSFDRLSIFGLMVKPVQRFPQFIMFLQDLIKFTPQNHDDRRALQLALTELENVAYRLNERKRQSEQKFQAHQVVQQLIRQKMQHVLDTWNLDQDPKRRLIRSDSVEQLFGESTNVKRKDRKLILMNDFVLCVKVIQKEQSGYTVERYALRWMAKLKDLELKDSSMVCDAQNAAEREQGKISISQQLNKPEDDPFHLLVELSEMVHDHELLGQIAGIVVNLKRSYSGYGFSEEFVNEISKDLEHMIQIKEEQLQLVNNCTIILRDNSRSDKPHYMLQTQTAALRHDWIIDFLMAKLALDKSNILAWDGTSGSDGSDFDVIPAYFLKHLHVDVPKNYTKIKCAVPFFLNSTKGATDFGAQHLWVCSSTPVHGQVAILSVHSSKPVLVESFKACSCDITACELVPGCGDEMKPANFIFPKDTVWMATETSQILIFPLSSQDGVRRQPLASFNVSLPIVSMKFIDEKIFCGSENGSVTVYSHQPDGCWDVMNPASLNFGSSVVKFHFVHEDSVWLSCGNKLYQLEICSLRTQAMSVLNASNESHIDQVVKSGVGIWVSFLSNSVIKLFHLETMENLQEISVGKFVSRIRTDKQWRMSGAVEELTVTCLAVSRGLLWIGTSLGVVLNVPLPRLSDGVPLYRGSPNLSLHAHKGPVRFLILMQFSPSFLEANRSNSTRLKQNLQNLPSKEPELKDSQKKHEGSTQSDCAKLDESGQNVMNPQDHVTQDESVTLKEETSIPYSEFENQEKNTVDFEKTSSGGDNENLEEFDYNDVIMRNKNRLPGVDRKSKTLFFYTEIVNNRTIAKSRCLSQSCLDLSFAEPSEVEVLYPSLLEDEPGKGDRPRSEINRKAVVSSRKIKRLSSGRKSTLSSDFSSHSHSKSMLNIPHSLFNQRVVSQDFQSKISDKGTNSLVDLAESSTLSPQKSPPVKNRDDKSNSVHHSLSPSAGSVRIPNRNRGTVISPTRKAGNGAVVVISGGDGYCDLDVPRKESKTDDASVLMWIRKSF